jgi:hypothetical protein
MPLNPQEGFVPYQVEAVLAFLPLITVELIPVE